MPLPFHRRRLDPDAADFCRRSGATDRAAINAFVKGVKDLGLWDKMVCWPLRSSQNAGTGDTVYSLGGLGTFNGTRVNGPVWGADGITNSATGHITTNYFEVGGSQAHIFVGNSTTASLTRCYGSTLSDSNTKGIRFRDDAVLWGDGTLRQVFRSFTDAGNFKMAAALYNRPSHSYNYLNTSQGTENNAHGAVVAGENSLTILAAIDLGLVTQYYSGQAAFYGTVRAALTPSQYLAFYSLYKSTLGTGLGLP